MTILSPAVQRVRTNSHLKNLSTLKRAFLSYRNMLTCLAFSVAIICHDSSAQHWDRENPHHLSIFTGDTHFVEEDIDAPTIGIDYEFRVDRTWGFGFVLEHALSEINANTALAVADIHLAGGMIFQVGPGTEYLEEVDEFEFLFRLGALYEFEYKSWTLSPQIHYDRVLNADSSVVFGFAFGKGF